MKNAQCFKKLLVWLQMAVVVAFCLGLLSQPLFSQAVGTIVGTVTDSSGAVIPGATVTITSLGTAEKRTVQTDASGNYRVVNLVPGRYRVEVMREGFKLFSREPVVVEVDSVVRIDAQMAVGEVTEVVQVTSETPLLQTESAALGQVVESKTVLEMPLNGRNVMNLIALVPGVVPQGSTSGAIASNQSAGHTNNWAFNNYQIGGGVAGHGAQFVDGAPTNGLGGNMVALIVTQDAIQEFRVVTNNVSAEYGRFGGGVVNMATKSGSNEIHGAIYEYFRNKVLNANNFFANLSGQKKPAFNQNQYGASIGGPLRKDKTFGFFNFERYKASVGSTYIAWVPTLAQRAGDFSGGKTIYDALTTTTVDGKVVRTPFPGNQIPSSRFDETANVIANKEQYWPAPNANLSNGNFVNTPAPGGKSYQINARGDQSLSDKQRLFLRFTYWNLADISMNRYSNLTAGAASHQRTHQAVIGDTYTLDPSLILDLRLSFTRGFYDDVPPSHGRDMSVYGAAWRSLQKQMSYTGNIGISVSGMGAFGGMTVDTEHFRDTYALMPNMTKIAGRHSFKFGGDVRLMDYSHRETADYPASGIFNFDAGFTSADGTTAASAGGQPFASFMLGYVASGGMQTVRRTGMFNWYKALYFTDTFQISRNLTLNMGVRWDMPGAIADRRDSATVLLPDLPDSLAQSTGLPLKGGLALVKSAQWPKRTTEEPKNFLIAPRIGLAYRIGTGTVIRTGYGISYLPNDVGMTPLGNLPSNSPVNRGTTIMTTSVLNAGLVPLNVLSNPFPAGGIPGNSEQYIVQPAGRNEVYLASLKGLSIDGAVPWQPYAYMQQWNFSIQREVAAGTLVELAYGGSRGIHITTFAINRNQISSQYISQGSALLAKVANPLAGKVNVTSALNGATITQGQLLRPYPQYINFFERNAHAADTVYHAMQARMEKRFGEAGILNSNFTWSKNIGNASGTVGSFIEGGMTAGSYQDYTNLKNERSLLNFDVPYRFVTSYVLELPVGKGKRYLNSVSGPLGKIVSGWGLNGIVTMQSGFALSILAQSTALSRTFGAGTPRPNLVAGCDPVLSGSAQSRRNKWFNTACFVQPGDYQFGNEARVDPKIRRAGINNFDLTISKNTDISERFRLQFKSEFFNLFNRAQFGAPGVTLGTSTFGVVTSQSNNPRQVQFSLRLNF